MTKIVPTSEQLKHARKLFNAYDQQLELRLLTLGRWKTWVGDVNCLPATVAEIRMATIMLVHALAGAMTDLDRSKLYGGYMLLDSFVEAYKLDKLVELHQDALNNENILEAQESAKDLVYECRGMVNKDRIRELLDYEYDAHYNTKPYSEDDLMKMSEEEFTKAMELVEKHVVKKK